MPKTLLVVDHSPTIREAARLALEGEDWAVTAAATADEALEASVAHPFDAVLCDAALQGTQLCRRLRALTGFREVPMLLMGAAVTPEEVRAAGASGTLVKPFGSQELADALQGALDAQGFSLDLDALEPATEEEPLTLEELDPALSDSLSDDDTAETLEIIDLSGGEEFEELELIEDLELVEDLPALGPEPEAAPVSAACPEEVSLELDDLFAGTARPPLPAAPGTADFGEPLPAIELPADEPLSDADFLEPLEAEATADVGAWSFEPAAALEPTPFPSDLDKPLEPTSAAASAAASAVAASLPPHLDAESLAPLIERVVERVVERVAWEVVPRLAERLIREAIEKLQSEPPET